MRKKLLVGGGLIAALLVVALAVLLLVDFDSPSLGKAVREQVKRGVSRVLGKLFGNR
jgi:hypothetical protein